MSTLATGTAAPGRTASGAPPAVRVVDASVSYDRTPVLGGVNLEVAAGETLAILGPNGSGKSTLMRAMLGLVPLSAGRIELHGAQPRRFRDWSRIGYVPQRLSAGGGVPATVREVVASGQVSRRRRLHRTTAAQRSAVTEALEAVDLADRSRDSVHELSGGQQQRVLIARALAARPDTFLMDEPMAGVDAASQRALARTVTRLSARGATVVLVLHELGPLEPLIGRSVVLSGGRVAHDGAPPPPEGECARPGHDHVHPHAGHEPAPPALPDIEVPRRG
ncbi:metal ABC transporter ATP-binding protein [Streptomonospora litoralis]|uniref:High-affinity zinc uptake system ATP-binding protein ZnuC n=1 Tax=Streptomonospora litoralis TaxID=2498135 RepID=A0A4P6PYX6_9ACTN|nr:ABC transporter ATP-binding protein [Streptomonospora litoralis]QBI53333.1 High-affinity zinc uptake system ATP-binding protein ZnuC [Streptomonospora litoralis]